MLVYDPVSGVVRQSTPPPPPPLKPKGLMTRQSLDKAVNNPASAFYVNRSKQPRPDMILPTMITSERRWIPPFEEEPRHFAENFEVPGQKARTIGRLEATKGQHRMTFPLVGTYGSEYGDVYKGQPGQWTRTINPGSSMNYYTFEPEMQGRSYQPTWYNPLKSWTWTPPPQGWDWNQVLRRQVPGNYNPVDFAPPYGYGRG